ncbi:uncharacterized protein LOC126831998 [Patella vulgata]|uniref:uncharacterized protein LOC126831998 n=1 Tax=Patella vulgata TaxID=6465 RepID=UPI0024A949BE|nr:uncharacterized protein LOC126831998 [Patella vulgata]
MLRKGRIPVTDVNPHLLCVLCGGYFIDATTIIECLHSYCRTCIVRYLETSKMCPLCDVLVHKTKPLENLRADKTLQDLVYKLVPGLFESEMASRRKFYAEHPEACKDISLEDRGDAVMEKNLDSEEEQISLILELSANGRPPGIDNSNAQITDRRYLLCPSAVTVEHLKKFIRLKFAVPTKYQIQFYHTRLELSDNLTLCDISTLYTWRRTQPLRLFYMIYDPPPNQRKLVSIPEDRRRRSSVKKSKAEVKRKNSREFDFISAEKVAKIAKKGDQSNLLGSDSKSVQSNGMQIDKSDMRTVTRDVNENCVLPQSEDVKTEVFINDTKGRTCIDKANSLSKFTSLFIKPKTPPNGKHKLSRGNDCHLKSKISKLDIFLKNTSRKSKNCDSSKLLNDNKIVDGMKLLKINKNGEVFKCPTLDNSDSLKSPVKSSDTVKLPRGSRSGESLIRPGKNIKVKEIKSTNCANKSDSSEDETKTRVIIDINRAAPKSPFKFFDTKKTVLVHSSLITDLSCSKSDISTKLNNNKSGVAKKLSIKKDEVVTKPRNNDQINGSLQQSKVEIPEVNVGTKDKKYKNTARKVKDMCVPNAKQTKVKTDDVLPKNNNNDVVVKNDVAVKNDVQRNSDTLVKNDISVKNDVIVKNDVGVQIDVINKSEAIVKNGVVVKNDAIVRNDISEKNDIDVNKKKDQTEDDVEIDSGREYLKKKWFKSRISRNSISKNSDVKNGVILNEKDEKCESSVKNIPAISTQENAKSENMNSDKTNKNATSTHPDSNCDLNKANKDVKIQKHDLKNILTVKQKIKASDEYALQTGGINNISELSKNKTIKANVSPVNDQNVEHVGNTSKSDITLKSKDKQNDVAVKPVNNAIDQIKTGKNDVTPKTDDDVLAKPKNDVTAKPKNDVTAKPKNDIVKSKNDAPKKKESRNGVIANELCESNAEVQKNSTKTDNDNVEDSALCHHNSLIFNAGFATDPYSFEMDHQPLDLSDVSLKRCVKKSVILNK